MQLLINLLVVALAALLVYMESSDKCPSMVCSVCVWFGMETRHENIPSSVFSLKYISIILNLIYYQTVYVLIIINSNFVVAHRDTAVKLDVLSRIFVYQAHSN